MGKILIIDGSGFEEDLKNVIEQHNRNNPTSKVDYVILPNASIKTADEVKKFVEKIKADEYTAIFCHLRWIDKNIEKLDKLKTSGWFQPILKTENRVGVSNGSNFRIKTKDLELFQYFYSHKGAKNTLEEFLNE